MRDSGPFASEALTGTAVGCIFVALSCLASASIAGRGAFRLASVVIIGSHALLFVARPLYAILYQGARNIFTGGIFDQYFVLAEVIAGSGLLILIVAYSVEIRRSLAPASLHKSSSIGTRGMEQLTRLSRGLIALLVLGLVLYALYVASVGTARYLQILSGGRSQNYFSAVDGASGYFLNGISIASGAAICLWYLWTKSNGLGLKAVVALLIVVALQIPSLSAGSRSAFVPIVLILFALAKDLFPQAISVPRIVALLPVAFVVLIVAPGIWRDGLSRGQSLAQALEQAASPAALFGSFFGGLDTAMVDAFQLQVQAQVTGVLPPIYGSSYVSGALSWVPRALWAAKPVTVDQTLNADLFPITASRGIGFAFSIYSEPYFNFGLAGIIIILVPLGVVIARIDLLRTRFQAPWIPRVGATIATCFIFVIMRGNISFDSQRILIVVVPLLVVHKLLERGSVTRQTGVRIVTR